MARLYFDLHECGDITIDEEGQEVADLATARMLAVRSARDIIRADVLDGRLCLQGVIVVREPGGKTVMTLAFGDAVAVTPAMAA